MLYIAQLSFLGIVDVRQELCHWSPTLSKFISLMSMVNDTLWIDIWFPLMSPGRLWYGWSVHPEGLGSRERMPLLMICPIKAVNSCFDISHIPLWKLSYRHLLRFSLVFINWVRLTVKISHHSEFTYTVFLWFIDCYYFACMFVYSEQYCNELRNVIIVRGIVLISKINNKKWNCLDHITPNICIVSRTELIFHSL